MTIRRAPDFISTGNASMIQIGIHNTGYFSAAALFIDGAPVFASPEERLSRVKYDNGFPHKSIDEGLRLNNLSLDDVDEVVLSWNAAINAAGRYRAGFSRWVPHPMQRLYSNLNNILPKLTDKNITEFEQVARYGGRKPLTFRFINHHLAHIGMSWYTSPFDESAVFIADGYGERATTVYAHARSDGSIRAIKELRYPHSLGEFYATFTEFIGFRPEMDEWKLMGAAAYGDWRPYYERVKSLIRVSDDGGFELDLNYFDFFNFDTQGYFSRKFIALFGEPATGRELSKRDYDIAASVQKVFEETVFSLLCWLARETGSANLCLGGGSVMNCLMNGRIREHTPFKELYIPFAPDDMGNALGAVLYSNKRRFPWLRSYCGRAWTPDEAAAILDKYKIAYERMDDTRLFGFVAGRLAAQKTVGWFSGAMEFGQRALGNRSILGDPRNAGMKDTINRAIKYREAYRPFAPSILDEKGGEWFEDYCYTPYMEKALRFKDAAKTRAAAVVHADGTGRLQSVREADNPRYYCLIKAFGEATGVPILLNTSFNLNGEAITYSPEDALRTFMTSGLDVLVMENCVVEKGSHSDRGAP